MNIIPAIDLKDRNSVRLYQGDFDQEQIINSDPIEQARQIEAAGLTRLHLVDLDGARLGKPVNIDIIKAICEETNLKVEVGGGIRSMKQINTYLTSGVDRVILGSVALTDPQLVANALKQFGSDQIVVGVDGKDGLVAIKGWVDKSDVTIKDLIENMTAFGINQFIVTDIQRDGTLTGPNIELLKGLNDRFENCEIIASGGVSNRDDLEQLAAANLNSVIVGRAMATGALPLSTLSEVMTNAS
ncbi:1-(5-phosphoribosyl)-5-[(5-phosphoribosylamino)methylideneamino]imidazole-4-carboxamide isomerase [Lactobacillaceae bacterium Scapto_B20]